MYKTHIIGAGVAGLAAAVSLVKKGLPVVVYESGGHAGGRCRSFFDTRLQCTIDNGNHLLLSGNRSVMRYLDDIDASDRLIGPKRAIFHFIDIPSRKRWCVKPNSGPCPWWIFSRKRRVLESRALDYISALNLPFAGKRTVTDCLGKHLLLFERFWEPLAVGVLNTPAQEGAASLLWPVLKETFGKGEAFCRPRIAKVGLSDALVDPAVRFLGLHGITVRFNHRLQAITCSNNRVCALHFPGERIVLNSKDTVLLALPPWSFSPILPELAVPGASQPIVNVHFRLPVPAPMPDDAFLLGVIGGTGQWLFARNDMLSTTTSAASSLTKESADIIARKVWNDVAIALDMNVTLLPAYRVIKEKRATFAQTPGELPHRVKTYMPEIARNLYIAGDWVDTGLPATIEGAIRSGYMATRTLLGNF